jgi:hypothetical protein
MKIHAIALARHHEGKLSTVRAQYPHTLRFPCHALFRSPGGIQSMHAMNRTATTGQNGKQWSRHHLYNTHIVWGREYLIMYREILRGRECWG